MAVYAIGDVQGCYYALRALLDRIAFDPRVDQLWFVGDLVNRGPHSLEVLRFVRGLGDRAIVVLGNHDLHLVSLAEGFGRPRADDTLAAVMAASDAGAMIAWLRARPLMHVAGDVALVHAGLVPQWSVERARALAREVESVLSGADYRDFLSHMYGSQPDRWTEDLAGHDRLRVIVNAMTRMRFCSAEGRMDFHHKGPATGAPPGFHAWFDAPGRRSATHTLICGHWSALGLLMRDDLLAIDTGCVWGGRLTAIRLDDRALFQVDGKAA